jgi:hypothetical protein
MDILQISFAMSIINRMLILGALAALTACGPSESKPKQSPPAAPPPAKPANFVAAIPPELVNGTDTNLSVMEVAKAVMVTVELDFGPQPPSFAGALREIVRWSKPDDGQGRTFAILDAYGQTNADNKLHISMHVSSEKPGIGVLMFQRTGEILWKSRIVPAAQPPKNVYAGKNLLIMINDTQGKEFLLDGSHVKDTIMDAVVQGPAVPLRQFWPDGEDRQITFIYSACGCPVKVKCRRAGEKTFRTTDLPVIFPDDQAVAVTIARLMGWQ